MPKVFLTDGVLTLESHKKIETKKCCALYRSNVFGEKSFLAWNYNSLHILTHVEKTRESIINLKVFRGGSLFF